MATIDQLLQAFNQFGNAAKEYGAAQGIRDATDEVQQLNQRADMDFRERIAAQQQVANQLQGRLAGLGMNAAAIAQAVGSIQPQQIRSSADAIAAAQQATDPAEREAMLEQAKKFQQVEGENMLETRRPLITFQTDEEIRKMRARLAAEPKGSEEPTSEAYKAFERETGKLVAEFKPAEMQRSLNSLESAAKMLDEASLGPISGRVSSFIGGTKTAEVSNKIRGAIQNQLRQVYGAQFTEKEGERFFDTLFDPKQDAATNKLRINAFSKAMRAQGNELARQKDYLLKNKTMRGYEPQLTLDPEAALQNAVGGGPSVKANPSGQLSIPAGMTKRTVRNKITGQTEIIFVDQNGNKFKP